MEKEGRLPEYRTIQRLQKSYLVRCGEPLENVIPGNGVKPVSQIKRIEGQIKELRQQLGKLAEEQLLMQADTTNEHTGKALTELKNKEVELTERIKELEKQLLECELL